MPDGRVAVRGRVAFAVSLLLALAPIASAGSVKIRATRIDKGTLPESLEIVAQSAGTSKAEVLRGSSGTMVLPDGAWVLQARAAGFWSEAIEVAVTSERLQDVAIRVLPTRTVAVSATSPDGPLREMRAQFSVPPDSPSTPLGGLVACIPGRSCEMPAVALDVVIRSKGYVPRYFWNVSPSQKTLPKVQFRPGGSISGFIGGDNPSSCGIVLETPEGQPVTDGLGNARRFPSATRGPRGFFQLPGLATGRFRVRVNRGAAGMAQAIVRTESGVESRIQRVLVPDPGQALTIRLSPESSPSGDAWIVTLRARTTPATTLYRAAAARNGVWRYVGVPPGKYEIQVGEGSARWAVEPVDVVADGDNEYSFNINAESLRGDLKYGAEPLQAKVSIGGRFGSHRLVFETDARGEFEGSVPTPLAGPAVDVSVSSPERGIDTTIRNVRIEDGVIHIVVPKTRVLVNLVDARGEFVPGGLVTLTAENDEVFTALAPATGQPIEFTGLASGRYVAIGSAEGRKSSPLPLNVKTGGESRVEIRLEQTRNRTLRVVGSDGQGVPGARVVVRPRSSPESAEGCVTNIEGECEVPLLPTWRDVAITVAARGYGFHMSSTQLPASEAPFSPILLTRAAGSLFVDVRAALPLVPFLFRGGAAIDMAVLAGEWSRPAPEDLGYPLRDMEPGGYHVCLVRPLDAAMTTPGQPGVECESVAVRVGEVTSVTLRGGREPR